MTVSCAEYPEIARAISSRSVECGVSSENHEGGINLLSFY